MKFCLKIFLALIPIGCYYAFPFFVFFKSGEIFHYSYFRDNCLNNENILVGAVYKNSNKDHNLKLNLLKKASWDVVAIGSSRALEYRRQFFNKDIKFINAGRCITDLGHLSFVVDHIEPNHKVDVMLVILDQWWFNPKSKFSTDYDEIEKKHFSENIFDIKDMFIKSSNTVYADYYQGKFEFKNIFEKQKTYSCYGLNAIMNHEGLRADGSYRYGKYLKENRAIDYTFNVNVNSIKNGLIEFQHSNSIGQDEVNALEKFILKCKAKKIKVVFVLPPFAPYVMRIFKELGSQKFAYVLDLHKKIQPLIESNGYEIYDYTDVSKLGSGDNEFFGDSYHASEVTMAKIVLDISKSSKIISKYININKLKNDVKTSKSPLYLYND